MLAVSVIFTTGGRYLQYLFGVPSTTLPLIIFPFT